MHYALASSCRVRVIHPLLRRVRATFVAYSLTHPSLSGLVLCAGDLAGQEWWERQGLIPPEASPAHNLQRVLADVFQEEPAGQQAGECGPPSQAAPQHPLHLNFPKTAPTDSLLVRQAGLLTCLCYSMRLCRPGCYKMCDTFVLCDGIASNGRH